MHYESDWSRGQTVRLTTPYLDAERGHYKVVFVYSNGWLGLVSPADGRLSNVPAHICRQVEAIFINAD